ncbi:MAG TPA: HAMP domain-containing sensor histidine kinase [Kofleriaceae bacterium]
MAAQIRQGRQRIVDDWEASLKGASDLTALSRPVLIDHVPDFLEGLADWLEGVSPTAGRAIEDLAEGHALQRLGYGVGLETLTREYGKLRHAVLRELLRVTSDESMRASLLRLDEGLDHAVAHAVRRYASHRDRVRDRFVAILGHDLRDPLAAIRMAADMLADGNYKSSPAEMAAKIQRSCSRAQRMVADILDFARSHLGAGIPVAPTRNNMEAICSAAIAEVGVVHPDRTISLVVHGAVDCDVDRERAHQAISNLLRNAITHGHGAIEISVSEAENHEAVVTSVTNHGTPIPPEQLRTLFDPYPATKNARTGLGLGLFIVNQIAIGHGARCEVESTSTATTVRIAWPRTQDLVREVAIE